MAEGRVAPSTRVPDMQLEVLTEKGLGLCAAVVAEDGPDLFDEKTTPEQKKAHAALCKFMAGKRRAANRKNNYNVYKAACAAKNPGGVSLRCRHKPSRIDSSQAYYDLV